MLGKIWKEHCNLVNPDILKTDNTYNNEVVKLMSKSKKKEYCSILDKCDDIDKYTLKVSFMGIKINKILERKAYAKRYFSRRTEWNINFVICVYGTNSVYFHNLYS